MAQTNHPTTKIFAIKPAQEVRLLLCYRWNRLLEQISEQLRSGKALLGLWQRYKLLHGQCLTAVQKQEAQADRLLKRAIDREITEEEGSTWMKDCSVSTDLQAPRNADAHE